MQYKEIISSCYGGNGSEKLKKAEDLFKAYGGKLLQETQIQDQLAVLRNAVSVLDAHMTTMEMGKTCTACAATSKGGCCSAYMGHENNDVLQLLMNILAGVDVKLVCGNEIECCFLAETGCILAFKPIFCLNYLCWRIQEESDEEQLGLLEQKTGTLLTDQGKFEQLIISFLQSQDT